MSCAGQVAATTGNCERKKFTLLAAYTFVCVAGEPCAYAGEIYIVSFERRIGAEMLVVSVQACVKLCGGPQDLSIIHPHSPSRQPLPSE